MTTPSGGDAFVAALAVFALSFAILSGTGVNLRNRPGAGALLSARGFRLLVSLGLAGLTAAWMMLKQ